MTKRYSMDLRERVVVAVERDGMSRHEAAARFDVAASSAVKWVQRYRETGSVAPAQMGGHKPRLLGASIVTGCWNEPSATSSCVAS